MSHVGHFRRFAIIDVDLTGVVDGASESSREVEKICWFWFLNVFHAFHILTKGSRWSRF
jgi:hypothetical protein